MTLNACQLYLQQTFNGLISPLPPFTQPMQAYIQPPVPGVLAVQAPQIYIWGAYWRDTRSSIPRSRTPGNPPGSSAWKNKVYQMYLYIIADTPANAPFPDSAFPLVINTVENAMYNATMPATLLDPTTQQVSEMMNLGEEIVGDYDVPRTLQAQRYLRYLCRLTVTITEMYQD